MTTLECLFLNREVKICFLSLFLFYLSRLKNSLNTCESLYVCQIANLSVKISNLLVKRTKSKKKKEKNRKEKKKLIRRHRRGVCWAKHCLFVDIYPPNVQDLQGGREGGWGQGRSIKSPAFEKNKNKNNKAHKGSTLPTNTKPSS